MFTQDQFEQVLIGVLSNDQGTRKNSEAAIEQVFQTPDSALPMMLAMLDVPNIQARQMAAVLLRRKVTSSLFNGLNASIQTDLKNKLIHALQTEQNTAVRSKLVDSVGEVGCAVLEASENQWPELHSFIVQCCQGEDAIFRGMGYTLLSKVSFSSESALHSNFDSFVGLVSQGLTDASAIVQSAAVDAAGSLIMVLGDEKSRRSQLQSLVPAVMSVLFSRVSDGDDARAEKILEEAIGMVTECAGLFKPYLKDTAELMLGILEKSEMEESVKASAVELLVCLCEALPGAVRKEGTVPSRLIPAGMRCLAELEESDANRWNSLKSDDDLESELCSNCKESLDRISCALNSKTVLGVMFAPNCIPAMIDSEDWRQRHAALTAIAQMAEGVAPVLLKDSQKVVTSSAIEKVIQRLQDPHYRVQWAAINTLGQLLTDLKPVIQARHHEAIVGGLMTVLNSSPHARVQAHAAASIVNFADECPQSIMQQHAVNILTQLVNVLSSPNVADIVLQEAVSGIAQIADTVGDNFVHFYDRIMPLLKQVLASHINDKEGVLRGRTMECISLVGLSVGREKFSQDASEVMQVLASMKLSSDDPNAVYLAEAWGRIASCLKEGFLPFLDTVLPPLFDMISQSAEECVGFADEEGDAGTGDQEQEVFVVGRKRYNVRTAAVEDKTTGLRLLLSYFDALNTGMMPYIQRVLEIAVPLQTYLFSDAVRTSVAPVIAACVKAMAEAQGKVTVNPALKGVTDNLIPKLCYAMNKEFEPMASEAMALCLSEIIKLAGPECLTDAFAADVMKSISVTWDEYVPRFDHRHDSLEDDGEEDIAAAVEAAGEGDVDALDAVIALFGQLVRARKESIWNLFQGYHNTFFKSVTSHHNSIRRVGLCLYIELLEGLAEAAEAYIGQMASMLINACNDKYIAVKQAAVFGLGICCQFGGASFAPHVPALLQFVQSAVATPVEEDAQGHFKDNAVSAVAKALQYQSQACGDAGQVISLVLSNSPLKFDVEEAVHVNKVLCSVIETGAIQALGSPSLWMHKVLSVFTSQVGTDACNAELQVRFGAVIKGLQSSLPAEVQAAAAQLTQEEQANLAKLVA